MVGAVVLRCDEEVALDKLEVWFERSCVANVSAFSLYPALQIPSQLNVSERRQLMDKGTASPGETHLPFSFSTPTPLPGSYNGPLIQVSYAVRVRLHRPWKRDVVTERELWVTPRSQRSFTSDPVYRTGGNPSNPTLELRLDSQVSVAGQRFRGAISVSSLSGSRLEVITVELKATELLATGQLSSIRGDVFVVPLVRPRIGSVIPFELEVPEAGPLTQVNELFAVNWHVEVKARRENGYEHRITVPVAVVDSLASVDPPSPGARPVRIGNERNAAHWVHAAAATSLQLRSYTSLAAQIGDTHVRLMEEVLESRGPALIARASFRPLGVGLSIGASQIWRSGADLRLGAHDWDAHHNVKAQMPEQAQVLLEHLAPVLTQLPEVVMTDDSLLSTTSPDPGNVLVMARLLEQLAAALDRGRAQIPPPDSLAHQVDEWRALADNLDGSLDTADMRVECAIGGMRGSIATKWIDLAPGVRNPASTELVIHTEHDNPSERRFAMQRTADQWRECPVELRELRVREDQVLRMLEEALEIEVAERAITLRLPAPVPSPLRLAGRLQWLHDLARAMHQPSGPYR